MSTQRITIPFVSQKVEDLLMWRDPKKSGIVFGSATAVFLFFAFFLKMPFIALVCYSLATALGLATAWARFGKTVGKPMPELPVYLREGMSETDYRAYTEKAKPRVDQSLSLVHGLLTAKDVGRNLKIIGGLFVAGKLLVYLSPIAIAYLFVLIAFGAPKVYEMHKDKIDEGIAQAKVQTQKGYDVAKSEINKAVEKVPALKNMRDRMAKKTE